MSTLSVIKGTTWAPFTSATASASGGILFDAVGFNNTGGAMTSVDLRLNITSASPTAGGTLSIYIVGQQSGSAYPNPGNSAANPPGNFLAGTYVFTGGATTIIDIYDMPMTLPYQCSLLLVNNSSASLTINTSVAQPKTLQMS